LIEFVGPVPFSAQYLICRPVQMDRQTDRQTDELIQVGLGNLRFLQVNHPLVQAGQTNNHKIHNDTYYLLSPTTTNAMTASHLCRNHREPAVDEDPRLRHLRQAPLPLRPPSFILRSLLLQDRRQNLRCCHITAHRYNITFIYSGYIVGLLHME